MDTRLLRHYETELAFMREMGAEFAAAYPKIAARLGMDGIEVLDPYVERLLEGVAFMAGRVQLELELQYPAFTSHLFEIIYPHYLAPTPSMMVAELVPDLSNAALNDGATLPRGTQLRSQVVEGAQNACIFRTAQDTTLWPLEVSEAEYLDGRGELVAAGVVAPGVEARGALRLRLRRPDGQPLEELTTERLTLYLGGEGVAGWQLYELLAGETTAVVARSTDRRADWTVPMAAGVERRGFAPDEALLPVPQRSFDGYRLLQEYFAMPERFHFVDLVGLERGLARCRGPEMDVYILFRDGHPDIAAGIEPGAFKLNCVPAINLFERRCDRTLIQTSDAEQHVIVNRTAPLDFEVHSLISVTGIGGEGEDDVEILPFYCADDLTAATSGAAAYYTQSRKRRARSERERVKRMRSSYLGSEMFLALVDPAQAPYSGGLRQLAIKAMVTNRDLPLLLSSGAAGLFHLPDGGPVAEVRTPVPPTRPRPPIAEGDTAWRLISHLSLNYLSLTDTEGGTGAAALREMVGLYVPPGNRALQRQVDGLVSLTSRPIVRRMSDEVLSTAVRGLEVSLNVDEEFFEGSGVYVLGAVLAEFFRGHTAINSFTETVLSSQQRGEIARWAPKLGLGRIL
ncbi:type VI secretion system baseplate subunit TssF [Rhodobacteraceae bacterium CCMM004]|nr:type VI secretion system baseplate subunit TssF [Rhodobacteraceae bacterium CCMM004]